MATAPELPFLGAGAVALLGGVKREGGFPSNGIVAVIGTTVLVIVASSTANTRLAPLVRAIGLVLLLAASYGTVRAFQLKSGPRGSKAAARGKVSPNRKVTP